VHRSQSESVNLVKKVQKLKTGADANCTKEQLRQVFVGLTSGNGTWAAIVLQRAKFCPGRPILCASMNHVGYDLTYEGDHPLRKSSAIL